MNTGIASGRLLDNADDLGTNRKVHIRCLGTQEVANVNRGTGRAVANGRLRMALWHVSRCSLQLGFERVASVGIARSHVTLNDVIVGGMGRDRQSA